MHEYDIEMADAEPLQCRQRSGARRRRIVRIRRCWETVRRGNSTFRCSLGALSSLPTFDERMYFVAILVVQVVPEASFGESEPVPSTRRK